MDLGYKNITELTFPEQLVNRRGQELKSEDATRDTVAGNTTIKNLVRMFDEIEITNLEDRLNNTEKKSLLEKNEHNHHLNAHVKNWRRIFKVFLLIRSNKI